MSDFPLVYVVLLTYNHWEETRQALHSLVQMTYPNYRLLVVDNQSTDGTIDQLQSGFPEIEFLINPCNLGFAAGINVGLRHALERGAEFILIINNDVVVAPSMLEYLIEAMTPDVGAAAPLIYSSDNSGRIWSSGFIKHPFLLEMRGGDRGRIRELGEQPFAVDYLLGCALLLRSSVLKQVGLFDEQYFFYYEDLDLSLRIQEGGHRLITVPKAQMHHVGAGSAGKDSPFRVYHMARGSVIFFGTHTHGFQYFVVFLFRLLSSVKKSLLFVCKGDFDLLRSYWQGLKDGWRAC